MARAGHRHGPWRRLFRVASGHHRSAGSDLLLASILAFVAGASNLGGLFALGHFASHMTGYLTLLADGIFIAQPGVILISLMALALFVTGGVFATMQVIWLDRHARTLRYALPVAEQGALLIAFAATALLPDRVSDVAGLAVLVFTMGLQNAMITKISRAQIRTTHMTGLVTDLSIEAGRALSRRPFNATKMRILSQIVVLFFCGGLTGSWLYAQIGFGFAAPLGVVLIVLTVPVFWRWRRLG